MPDTNSYKAIMFMLASTLSLSLIGLITKYLAENIEVGNLMLLRFFLPALILMLLLAVTKLRFPPKEMRKILMIRSLSLGACQLCFIYAIGALSLVESVVLFGTGPIFITLLEKLFFNVSIKRSTIVAIVLTFFGVILLASGQSDSVDVNTLQPATFKPEILIALLAGLFNASSQLSLHKASKGSMTSIESNAWTFLIGGVCLLPIVSLLSIGGQVALEFTPHWSELTVVSLLVLALFIISNQVARYKAYQLADTNSQLAPLIYTNLVFTAMLQFCFFEQTFSLSQIAGLAIIITANCMCSMLPIISHSKILKRRKRQVVIPT